MASSLPPGGGGAAPPQGGRTEVPAAPGGRGLEEGGGGVVMYSGVEPLAPLPGEGDDAARRKKTTSFKITNVFASRPPSNDGDESPEEIDDLEDSHTEDLSEMADSLSSQLETMAAAGTQPVNGIGPPPQQTQGKGKPGTPSADTRNRKFSQEKGWDTDAYHAHPGFGFVTYNHDAGYQVSYVDKTTGQLPIAGTMAVIVNNNSEKGTGVSEVPVSGPQDFKNRFKIVKVETTEPLKRGRWTCFDFVDKPASKDKVTTSSSEADKQASAVKASLPGTTASGVIKSSSGGGQNNVAASSSRPASVAASVTSTPAATQRPPAAQDGGLTTGGLVAAGASDSLPQPDEQQQTLTAAVSSVAPVESVIPASSSSSRQPSGGGGGVPPAGLKPGTTVSASPANGPAYTTQLNPSHSLPPNQQNISSLTQVQSPSGMTTQLLGQVIRLPDGQLAQVALAPFSVLPHQSQQGNATSTGPGYSSHQTIILQPINPAQSNLAHKPVVMNPGGQLVVGSLVQPGQQQSSTSQTQGGQSGAVQQQSTFQQQAGSQQPSAASSQQQPTFQQQAGSQQSSAASSQQQSTLQQPNAVSSQQQGTQPTGSQQQNIQSVSNQQQGVQSVGGQARTSQTLAAQQQQLAQAQLLQQQQQVLQQSTLQPPQSSQLTSGNGSVVIQQKQSSQQNQLNLQHSQIQNKCPASGQPSQQKPSAANQQLTSTSVANQQLTSATAAPSGQHSGVGGGQQSATAGASIPQSASSSASACMVSAASAPQNHSQPSVSLQNQHNSGGQQQPSGAAAAQQQVSGQQQAQTNNLQYSQQVPVVVSLQQSQQTRASQQQMSSQQPIISQQQLQQQTSNAPSIQQQHQQFINTSNSNSFLQQHGGGVQQPLNLSQGVVGQGGGYSQLQSGQINTQSGAVVSSGSGKSSVSMMNGGVITLAGYPAPLGEEGLVEQLEISLLQEQGDGKEIHQDPETDSSTGSGQGTIDNRIEQAMDLVKSHLMSAVRSEVEELKDRISKLEETVTVLSRENEFLRANVNQDVLASLSGIRPHAVQHQPPDAQHQ